MLEGKLFQSMDAATILVKERSPRVFKVLIAGRWSMLESLTKEEEIMG
jgi:hypothetical protein